MRSVTVETLTLSPDALISILNTLMMADNERSVSNGGSDAKQQKDAGEIKEVDAENKPEESNGLGSTLKKSPACKTAPSNVYPTVWAA